MAFRKFGGLNYATNNNIVHNTYSNTKNLTVSNQAGAPNSNLLIQSNFDMSGNSLFGIGEAHFETGFITSNGGLLTFDNSSTVSSGLDLNAGTGMTLRGMDFNNAQGTTFQFNTTNGGTISLHNQDISVATDNLNLTAPPGQSVFIDPVLTVPKITTRPGTDLFISTGSPDGYVRIDRDVGITGNIIQLGDSLFQGNVGITGTLGVTGRSIFDGSVGVTGLFGMTGRSTFNGSVGITGLFGVTGRSTFNGSVGVTGLFGVTGSSVFDGSVGVTGLFGVTGMSTFNGSVGVTGLFGVTGTSTFDGSVGITGLFGVTGSSIFDGTVGITGLFGVTGTSTFDGTVGVTGLFGVTGSSVFDGSVGVTGFFGVTGSSIFDGSVGVSGLFGVTGSSVFDGAVGVSGAFGVTGSSIFDGTVGITGLFGVTGSSVFDGSVGVSGLFGVTGSSVFDGSVGVTGFFGVTGSSIFDGSVGVSGLFGVTGSSVFDGSVGVSGLFGVTGSSVFDGSVGITGFFGVTGASTFDGSVVFNGSADFNSSVGFNGSIGVSGAFGVTGTSTFDGSVGITGMFGVTGTSTFDGSVGITGLFGVTGASTFDGSVVFKGSVDFNSSVGFNGFIGVSGAFGVTGTSTFDGSVGITGMFGVTGASVFNGTVEFVDYVPTCKIGPTGDYDLTNKSYVLSVISAGGVTLFNQNNIWTGTNIFKHEVGVSGPFGVTGASIFNGSSTFVGSVGVSGPFGVTGASIFDGSSTFVGSVGVSGPFGVTGETTFNGSSTFVGSVGITGMFGVTGASVFNGTVEFVDYVPTCAINPTEDYDLTNKQYVLSVVSAGGDILFNQNNTWKGTNTFENAVDVIGPFGVTGASVFNGDLTLGTSSNLVLTTPSTTLTQTWLSYLSDASSNIQTQLNGKVNTTGPEIIGGAKTFSSDTTFNGNLTLGASSNLVLNSGTTLDQTELAFLNGVTSEIVTVAANNQTITGSKTFNSDLTLGSGSNLVLTTPSISVTQTELSYLDGATNNIQNQITDRVSRTNNVTESINGAKTFSNNATFNGNLTLGASSNLVLNSGTTLDQTELAFLNGVDSAIVTLGANNQTITGSKTFNNLKLNGDLALTTPSISVTQTELSYLDGATNNIQNQITDRVSRTNNVTESINGAKTFSNNATFNGNLTLGASSNLVLNSGTTLDQTELAFLNGVDSAIVTLGANNQTITGSKTFSNLKLNGDLALTTPSISVTQTELSYLDGATNNIQNQITDRVSRTNNVTESINGAKTFSNNATFNGNLILGASSNLVLNSGTTIDQTELAFLNGVDSAIVTLGANNQTITGSKTFNNLKLNGDLALTTPSISVTQTELSYLDGATNNIQNQITDRVSRTNNVTESINGAKTFSNNATFNGNLTLGASSNLVLNSGPTIEQTELAFLNGVDSAIVTLGANNQTITGSKTFSSSGGITFTGPTTFSGTTRFNTNLILGAGANLTLSEQSSNVSQANLNFLKDVTSEIVTVGTSQIITSSKTFSGNLTTFRGGTVFTTTSNSNFNGAAIFDTGSITTFNSGSSANFSGTTTFNTNLILGNSSKIKLNDNTEIEQSELAFLNGVDSAIVTLGANNQTITGSKTFNNLKLNGDLALTTPSISVTQTELSYLDGATNNIQNQITDRVSRTNNVTESINGAKTFTDNTTFSGNLILGASSNLVLNSGPTIEQTELAFLNGVDSAIVTLGANNQTIAGSKTFSGGITFTSSTTFSGTTRFTTAISGTTALFTGEVDAGSFDATSDYRIKQNVTNLGNTYTLDNLRPVSYYNTKLQCQDLGFIAHEVQQEIPHIVSGEKDGEKLQSINYNRLIPILVKELNEQKQENKQNKELINKLMQSNEYLMKHVNELMNKLL